MIRLSALVAAVLLTMLLTMPASADCLGPEPAVIWTLPAPGEVDVPANAKLWVLSTVFGGDLVVEVDGTAARFEADQRAMFDPGVLEPGEHSVEVSFTDDDGIVRLLDAFVFTSDESQATIESDAPSPARIERVADRQLSETCAAALANIDCFDTGQDTHYVVEVAPADGYVMTTSFKESGNRLQQTIWPGECGFPEAFLGSDTKEVCIDVVTIGFGGSSPSGRVCEGAFGCSKTGAMPLFAAAAALLCVRRRRRYEYEPTSGTPALPRR